MIDAQSDRRNFRRMAIESGVEVTLAGQKYEGMCVDLSATGMSITVSDNVFKPNDEVFVQLTANGTSTPPLKADAVVLRIQPHGDKYSMAVQFSKLS